MGTGEVVARGKRRRKNPNIPHDLFSVWGCLPPRPSHLAAAGPPVAPLVAGSPPEVAPWGSQPVRGRGSSPVCPQRADSCESSSGISFPPMHFPPCLTPCHPADRGVSPWLPPRPFATSGRGQPAQQGQAGSSDGLVGGQLPHAWKI